MPGRPHFDFDALHNWREYHRLVAPSAKPLITLEYGYLQGFGQRAPLRTFVLPQIGSSHFASAIVSERRLIGNR
jgi:hypothetical protein